ncbi:Uncharacterised protein [Staphylococcus gallinarum]|uniref:Uncharacterized protein n=1 Tax=Staphylococcus gallinarum TaxID=1293 RepID=A0A380FDZ0_STAGA|nr:Uncharacterised protein [Staphylococcus gallinarum]
MILDKVNPNDLYPTEEQGPTVLGTIEYNNAWYFRIRRCLYCDK